MSSIDSENEAGIRSLAGKILDIINEADDQGYDIDDAIWLAKVWHDQQQEEAAAIAFHSTMPGVEKFPLLSRA
jgi:hypothetical protein